ncbi:MAG: glycosyltransferase family 4 protein [Candidatus Sericytochromatia bacterium]|nr:glycosyltransferase family 4 protein [Candidatus Sericytochromatia bacterium]
MGGDFSWHTAVGGNAPRVTTPVLPDWVVPLWQRFLRLSTGRVAFFGLSGWAGQSQILSEGWQRAKLTDGRMSADAVIGMGADWALAAACLQEGGSFMWLIPGAATEAADRRREVETAFAATAHLLEIALDGGWMAIIGWKGDRLPAGSLEVLMVSYLSALVIMGGSETQLFETLKALRGNHVRADVSLSLRLDPAAYALVHCFGVYAPDKYEQIQQLPGKLVISTIYWDFSRTRGETILTIEILKQAATAAEAVERLDDWHAGLLGLTAEGREAAEDPPEKAQKMRAIFTNAAHLLPNGRREAEMLLGALSLPDIPYTVVPNAALTERFLDASPEPFVTAFGLKDFVLCAGRIEPRKNQHMLIWALRDTGLPLVLVGRRIDADYERLCRRWAGDNVHFIPELSPQMLASAYAAARVHAMPSWVETPGIANLEAALAGCNLVVGNRAIETEYFGDLAYVCDPANWRSIRDAVTLAWQDPGTERRQALRQRILTHFTWSEPARITAEVYHQVIAG